MDPHQWNFIDNETEQEVVADEKFGRDCIICAIDCSEPMFMIKSEDGLNHFELSIKVVFNLYNRKCLTNERDLLGILLYNTAETKNSHNFEHIYVFHELGMPGAEKVKEIEDLIKAGPDVRQNFKQRFGHADCKLDEMFWICATMFNNTGLREGTKRIFLFTNCDNPHRNDIDRQKRVHQKIQDLREQMVNIELLPVGRDFCWENFYAAALFDDDKKVNPNPADKFDELMSRTLRKQYKKRAMATIPFSLAPGLEISCSLFNMIAPARLPLPIKLEKRTNEEVKTLKAFVDVETGEKLLPVDLKKFQTYGGSKIAMEPDEVEQMRKLCPPGLVLIGFLKKTVVKPYHHIRQSLFMYPTDSSVKGSTALFTCLLERCSAKDVVAICRLTARANMAPRLVALVPQLEEMDANGYQEEPPGFHVVFLPYADDMRDLERKIYGQEKPKADRDQIEKAKEIIEKLTIDYDPDTITNPVLQTHYKAIEAFALDREETEPVPDHTKPNLDWMLRKARQPIQEFSRMIYPADYIPGSFSAKKRGTGASSDVASKKPKSEGTVSVKLEDEAQAGRLNGLTVPVLKDLCARNGIKLTASRKADIIEQINAHFGL